MVKRHPHKSVTERTEHQHKKKTDFQELKRVTHLELRRYPKLFPIGFIEQFQRVEVSRDWMFCSVIKRQRLFAVTKTNEPKAGQADSLGEFVASLLTIDGPVDINEATAAFQIRVNIGRPLVVPVTVLEEYNDIGLFELLRARPFP